DRDDLAHPVGRVHDELAGLEALTLRSARSGALGQSLHGFQRMRGRTSLLVLRDHAARSSFGRLVASRALGLTRSGTSGVSRGNGRPPPNRGVDLSRSALLWTLTCSSCHSSRVDVHAPSTAIPRKASRKNTLPTGSASGFMFARYISHFPQKSTLCGTAK